MSQQAYKLRRLSVGGCPNCLNQLAPGKSHCTRCLKSNSNRVQKHMEKLTEKGLCTKCAINPLVNKSHCEDCRTAHNKHQKERRAKHHGTSFERTETICE